MATTSYDDAIEGLFVGADVEAYAVARVTDEVAVSSKSVKYGEQYEFLGRKKILRSNVEYVDENGYKYATDNQGRISHVSGKLNLGEGTRNPYAQRTVGGVDRLKTDDGGHLIGTQFNGSGQIDNLVPQSKIINRSGGEWYKMETEWATAIKEGRTVEVEIDPVYLKQSNRPEKFIINYRIDNEKITRIIKNE